VPHFSTGARVERVGLIRCGYEHESVDHYRSNFEVPGIVGVEHPLRLQSIDIVCVDLAKRTESAAGVVSVVRDPVVRRRLHHQVFRAHIDRGRVTRVRGRVLLRYRTHASEDHDHPQQGSHRYESRSVLTIDVSLNVCI